jgi:hypothetical protein
LKDKYQNTGWMHDGGVFFQLVTIKLLYALVLNKHVDTLSIFYVLDPNYIWNFFKGHIFFCAKIYLREVF